jgi:predicted GNAT family acetyltransferase
VPTVVPIHPEQWRELREIRLAALRDAPSAFGSTFAREIGFDERVWRERARRSTFFGVDDGVPVAMASGIFDDEDCAPDQRLLVGMWVSPGYRGRGLAAALIGAVADWARADGAGALLLDVALANPAAVRIYARAGFVPTGRIQPMPSDTTALEQQMVLVLAP